MSVREQVICVPPEVVMVKLSNEITWAPLLALPAAVDNETTSF